MIARRLMSGAVAPALLVAPACGNDCGVASETCGSTRQAAHLVGERNVFDTCGHLDTLDHEDATTAE